MSVLRSPLKVHGGKHYLANRIAGIVNSSLFDTYVEPFGGGFNVGLNRRREVGHGLVEVYNDLDVGKANFFRVVRDGCGELVEALTGVEYSVKTFDAAKLNLKSLESQYRFKALPYAVAYLVVNRMSRGGLGIDFGWSDRLRGGLPGDVNAWRTTLLELPVVSSRLQTVEIMCSDGIRLLGSDPSVLYYVDPPYVSATRTAASAYGDYELTDRGHELLLEAAVGCLGKVVLSGYRCDLYDKWLVGWRSCDIEMPNHSGQGVVKGRRVETLWWNF